MPGAERAPERRPERTPPRRPVTIASPAHDRLVRRSRIASYVLAALGAVVLSVAPSLIGSPTTGTVHVLLTVVRPVAAAVLVAAALGVQVVVGVRWRWRLRRDQDG